MNVHRAPKMFGPDSFLAAHSHKDVLRFITCGSVDDGKSTLIGRLLHDSKQLFDDQLIALRQDSRRSGTQREGIDFALLVDGLAAEREQGITIDVAYRFFSTDRRTFIVADTPGHEQYTRNMATGASTAELAVLLVDARKGLTRQTRRHSLLVAMLGIKRIVLAINKMDLVGWSQSAYQALMDEYLAFAAPLSFSEVVGIPLSALNGDNVVDPAVNAPWYGGPPLLRHLETVPCAADVTAGPFRMPVQWVNRSGADFRGYAGMVMGGSVGIGDVVRVLPAGDETIVTRIATFDGDLERAVRGQSVVITVADDVDISRGDVLAAPEHAPLVSHRIDARLFWIGDRAIARDTRLQLKLGAANAAAVVETIVSRVDPDTASSEPANALAKNEIGDVTLSLDRAVAFDAYVQNRDMGSFILIDPESWNTLGMGLIQPASTQK
jgi:sulfate adenylyltransferase subunit 1